MPWVQADAWLRDYERRRGEDDDGRRPLTTEEVEEALEQERRARTSHSISQAKRLREQAS